MTDIRIAHVRGHSIAIADPPLRSSYGLHAPYALRTVIELESDDGVVGLAETHGGEAMAADVAAVRPRLVGTNAWTLAAALMPMLTPEADGDRSQTHRVPGENPMDASARLYSALEMAALDLVGKSVGQPVCALLGGRVRDVVPFSAYLFYKHAGGGGEGDDTRDDEYGEALAPEAIVTQAQRMVTTYGFESIKLKAGVLEPDEEMAAIQALRRAFGGQVPLRIDPNCAWSVETSVRVGRTLAPELSDGGYLEDPAAGLDGMAAVRRALLAEGIDTPLASNVAVTHMEHLPAVVRDDAVQIVLCDPHYWGGLRQVQHLARTCQAFGLGLSMHSNSHLGISLMTMAHVAAASPHLTYACDTHYPWQRAEDEVVAEGRIPFERGAVRVSDAPGLGVTLDLDQLARGRERYARCTYRKRDDQAQMRAHVDPTWTRTLPRW